MVEMSTIATRPPGPGWRLAPTTTAVVLTAAFLASMTAVASAQSPGPDAPGTEPRPTTPGPADPAAPAAATAGWEYRTLFVTWDSAEGNWVADFSDGTRIVGLDATLNAEGVHGWELVAVVPELWAQVVDDAIQEDARRLRLFLKRPLG